MKRPSRAELDAFDEAFAKELEESVGRPHPIARLLVVVSAILGVLMFVSR